MDGNYARLKVEKGWESAIDPHRMCLIRKPVVDPNVASSFGGPLAGPSRTSGPIVPSVVPTTGSLPRAIIARRRQPLEDEEIKDSTEQQTGLVAILPPLWDEEVIEISAKEAA